MPKIIASMTLVDWNETPLHTLDEQRKITQVQSDGEVSGDWNGNVLGNFLLAYADLEDGTFKGTFLFTGHVDQKEGGFILIKDGLFDTQAASANLTILEGSGTGALTGISGTGHYRAAQGLTFDVTLEYSLD